MQQITSYCPMPDAAGRQVPKYTILSPRMSFQWHCVRSIAGAILDVGCFDDSMGFGHRVVHFDWDDWSALYHRRGQCFVQGDAHKLTDHFAPNSFELVVMGDIVEHLYDPYRACSEAARVTSRYLCMTIWEEWRGPGGKEQLAWSMQDHEDEAHEKGYETFAELYADEHPGCIPNGGIPHWGHIQIFTDEDMSNLVARLCLEHHMRAIHLYKAPEVLHEGHQCWNWLILLEKIGEDSPDLA